MERCLTALPLLECEALNTGGEYPFVFSLVNTVLSTFHTCLLKLKQVSGHREEDWREEQDPRHLGGHSQDQDRLINRHTDWLKLLLMERQIFQ